MECFRQLRFNSVGGGCSQSEMAYKLRVAILCSAQLRRLCVHGVQYNTTLQHVAGLWHEGLCLVHNERITAVFHISTSICVPNKSCFALQVIERTP